MNSHHGRASARPEAPMTSAVLRGDAWKARRIRNNCLRQHCHVLATTFRGRAFASLREVCARVFVVLETRSRVLTEIHPRELSVVAGVARLGAYAAQWLRQPEEWQPDPQLDAWCQWAGLMRHLLARYPVPPFLDGAWTVPGSLEHFERDCWCAVAQGRSLRMVRGFPRSIPRRVIHFALANGESGQRATGVAGAIWDAELRAVNASVDLQAGVRSSRIVRELGEHRLWRRLVAKFAANRAVPPVEIGFVANALAAIGAHRGRPRVAQLMALPARELIRHCRGFARRLIVGLGYNDTDPMARAAMAKGNFERLLETRWPPLLGTKRLSGSDQTGGAGWIIEELCSVAALEEEGRVLSHCVARYAAQCRAGNSAIFSVRCCKAGHEGTMEAIPCATVEVLRPTRRIAQVRAYRNCSTNNTILGIVRDWAAQHDLVCAM